MSAVHPLPFPVTDRGPESQLPAASPGLSAPLSNTTEWPTDLYPELHAMGKRIVLEDGAILTPGPQADSVYFILSGCLRSVIHSDEAHDHVIGLMRPGSVLGYVPALDGNVKLHDSIAKGKTELLAVPRGRFLALFRNNPDFAAHVVDILCRRVRATYAIVEEYTLAPRRRVARRLLRVAASFGRQTGATTVIAIRLPQEDWAGMTGLSRQTVNKVLRHFREEGLIIMRDAQLAILDIRKLRALAFDHRSAEGRLERRSRPEAAKAVPHPTLESADVNALTDRLRP